MRAASFLAACLALAGACGDDDGPDLDPDGGLAGPDGGGPGAVTTEHCTYAPLPATAGAGGSVSRGALSAGAAEDVFHVPVGTALGAYTARAQFLGSSDRVDLRIVDLSGSFNPSVGIESQIRIKALALSAGGETVVIIKADLGYPYEGQTF